MIPEQILHLLEPMLRSYLSADRADSPVLVTTVPEGILVLAKDGKHVIVRADSASLQIGSRLEKMTVD